VNVAKEIGKFYQNKKQWDKAIDIMKKQMLKIRRPILKQFTFASGIYRDKEFEKAKAGWWIFSTYSFIIPV
jgi:hypothetical protein